MNTESSLDEEKVLYFKNVNREDVCVHCIKNFDALLKLAAIDTDRRYFCEDCSLSKLVDLIIYGLC